MIDDRPVTENRAVNLIRVDTEPRVVSELLHQPLENRERWPGTH
jgi:hypothetical protein